MTKLEVGTEKQNAQNDMAAQITRWAGLAVAQMQHSIYEEEFLWLPKSEWPYQYAKKEYREGTFAQISIRSRMIGQQDTDRYVKKNTEAETYRNHLPSTRVDDAHTLVLAGRTEEAAITVPADIINEVWMQIIKTVKFFSCAHIPHYHHIITAWKDRCILEQVCHCSASPGSS